MLHVISSSLTAKVLGILSLFVFAFLGVYLILQSNVVFIETSLKEQEQVSNRTILVLEVNKDIVELQRDVSVFSQSGNEAIFNKIIKNYDSIRARLLLAEAELPQKNYRQIIESMKFIIERYDDNLKVLVSRYNIKEELISKTLPEIADQARAIINTELSNSTQLTHQVLWSDMKSDWFELERNVNLFLNKKDYSKQAKIVAGLSHLRALLEGAELADPSHLETVTRLTELIREFDIKFKQAKQANRNYFSLVNVVMAADSVEFSSLANQLTNVALEHLNIIKSESINNVKATNTILKYSAAFSIVLVVLFVTFFHVHVIRVIRRLTISFQKFITGDLSASISDADRSDELGVLSKAASRFREMSVQLSEARVLAENSAKAKSEFLANMSHEIRTPMNGVLGVVNMLKNTPLSKEQADLVEIISSSGKTLLVIINDILDLSKIEAGKIELEYFPCDINAMLQEVRLVFGAQAEEKHISFEVLGLPTAAHHNYLVDETRLKQILMNLIGNAIKFTEQGFVKLSVSVAENQDDKCALQFSVEDSGIGIAPDSLETLFEAFSQADSSITRRYGGTGLGLSISSKLLTLMNSTLKVESHVGRGSVFYFVLEVDVVNEEQAKIELYESLADNLSELNILVVEDNPVNRIVISAMLKELKCKHITMAEHGQKAVELCEQQSFDLIFMDMQMPIMDGPTATKKIRAQSLNENAYIVALTANVLEADKETCLAAGMNDFLTKPIDLQAVIKALNVSNLAPCSKSNI